MFKQLNRDTKLFVFIFLYTIFSGVLRKWVFVDQFTIGNIIFSVQLILPFLFMVFSKRGSNTAFSNIFLSVYTLLLFFLAISPLNKTLYHGILGVLIHLGFWYACFYYIANRSNFQIEKLYNLFFIVGIGMFVLVSIQYQLPARHFLNRYADESKIGNDIAMVGDSVRVTGTFSYLGGYSSFLIFQIILLWGLVKRFYNPPFVITLFLMGLVGAFMSGSRTTTFLYMGIGVMILITELSNSYIVRFMGKLIPVAVILYLVVLARGQLGVEQSAFKAYENFDSRREQLKEQGEEKQRLLWDFNDLFVDFKGKYPYFGIGLGSTYQGATALFGTSEYLYEYGYVENELTRVVVEGGFVLLAVKWLLGLYLISLLNIPLMAKGVIFFLISSLFIPIVFNVYFSAFIFLGLVIVDHAYTKTAEEKRRRQVT